MRENFEGFLKEMQASDNLKGIHPSFKHRKNGSKILHGFQGDVGGRNGKLRTMSQSYAFGFHGRKSQYPQAFAKTIGSDEDPIMVVNDFQECDINGNRNMKSSYDYNTQKLE